MKYETKKTVTITAITFATVIFMILQFYSCNTISINNYTPGRSAEGSGDFSDESSYPDTGPATSFKVPVPKGYDWEVTQSWAEHCEYCDEQYSDYDYCAGSHTKNCCKYAWDFNLDREADKGKPVLATADGKVKKISSDDSWGNYVILDHGNKICSRYTHLLDGSTDHLRAHQTVCQGLKIGEIGDSGSADGYHLHFQFERCDQPSVSIQKSFTDGNGAPKCARGRDVYSSGRHYDFLKLTNDMKTSCNSSASSFSDATLPEGGWLPAACGNLTDCPLMPNCGRETNHVFSDNSDMSSRVREAAAYLYSECALDGKENNKFKPIDKITRAEALKIPMYMFGLMENCGGGTEPYSDVSASDWFFPMVVCALRYGILDNLSSYFNPNASVTFAEAAKFIVIAASKAGVIQIKNPSQGHFVNIPSSHWSYKYVETLYAYGGVTETHLGFITDAVMDRGGFAIMTASMSPCFCRNIKCGGSCMCDQARFSCINPESNDNGTGGNSSSSAGSSSSSRDSSDSDDESGNSSRSDEDSDSYSSDNDEENESAECEPDCRGKQCGDDGCNGKCGECERGNYICQSGRCVCVPLCAGKQCGPDMCGAYCGSCAPGRICDNERGQCICGADSCGGECGTCPAGKRCDVGHCTCIPNCANKDCWDDGCGGSCGACSSGYVCEFASGKCKEDPCVYCPHGQCVNGQCAIGEWTCDPAVGYTLTAYSPGGSLRIRTSSSIPVYEQAFPPGMALRVHFDCIDLPAAMIVHGGDEGARITRDDNNSPPFAIWLPYQGELTLNPPYNPDLVVYGFSSSQEDLSVMIRIPAR